MTSFQVLFLVLVCVWGKSGDEEDTERAGETVLPMSSSFERAAAAMVAVVFG